MPWYLNNSLLIVLFAAQHSIGTTAAAKAFMTKLVGGRAYAWNALYNAGTFACIALMIYFWKPSDVVLWSMSPPWSHVMLGVEACAVIAFFYLFKFTQPFGEWLGYTQLWNAARGVSEPKGEGYKIKTFGIKRYIRFPHHTMLIIIFWALPTMTLDLFFLAVIATIYTWLGSVHQDFRGRGYFGEEWVAYTRNSRMLFPAIEHVLEDYLDRRKRRRECETQGALDVLPNPHTEGQ